MLPESRYQIVISLLGLLSAGAISSTQNCTSLGLAIANSSAYNPETLELVFKWAGANSAALTDCFLKSDRDTEHVLELVSIPGLPESFDSDNCCRNLCKGSRVQEQAYISTFLTQGSISFKYVAGTYIVRHRKCSCSKGYCFRCQTKWCSAVQTFGEGDIFNMADGCGEEQLSTLFQSSRFSQSQNQTVQNCTIDVTAVYGACNAILSYSEIEVSIFQVNRVAVSVSDPYSLNPDPSYFLPISEIFFITYKYKIFTSKEVNWKTECCKSH